MSKKVKNHDDVSALINMTRGLSNDRIMELIDVFWKFIKVPISMPHNQDLRTIADRYISKIGYTGTELAYSSDEIYKVLYWYLWSVKKH